MQRPMIDKMMTELSVKWSRTKDIIGRHNLFPKTYDLILLAEFAERRCSAEGKWEGKPGSTQVYQHGWANYSSCYTPQVRELFEKLGNDSEVSASYKWRALRSSAANFLLMQTLEIRNVQCNVNLSFKKRFNKFWASLASRKDKPTEKREEKDFSGWTAFYSF